MRTALLLDTVSRRRHICLAFSYSTVKRTDIDLWLPIKENNPLMLGVFCSNISVSVKDVRCYGIFKLGIKELYRKFVHQREVGGSHGDCYTDCSLLESYAVYSDRNLPTFSGSGCLHIRVRTGTCVQKRNTRVVFFVPRSWKHQAFSLSL